MIAAGSLVQIDRTGATRPVEALRAGDTVLNPFTGASDRVAAVMPCRLISKDGGRGAARAMLIPAGSLSRAAPSRDLVVSAHQEVMVARRTPGTCAPILSSVRAEALQDLGIPIETHPYPEVEYVCVTLTHGTKMVVNHVVCTTQPATPLTPNLQNERGLTCH